MIQDIEFTRHTNDFQQNLKRDIKNATDNTNLIVKADKTTNFYWMKTTEYQSLVDKNLQKATKSLQKSKSKVLIKKQKR